MSPSNLDIKVTVIDTAFNIKSQSDINPISSKHSDSLALSQLKRINLSTKKDFFLGWDPPSAFEYSFLPKMPPISERSKGVKVKIKWIEDVQGDFSFVNKLIGRRPYPDYRFPKSMREEDSLLNSRLSGMRDSLGNIFSDSVNMFQSIVDSTLHYTIISESEDFGCSGTRMMRIVKMENSIRAFYNCDFPSGKRLQLEIFQDSLSAWIEWEMVSSHGQSTAIIKLKEGDVKVDRHLFKKGILKAEFKFLFDPYISFLDDPINIWKGLIYGEIKQ